MSEIGLIPQEYEVTDIDIREYFRGGYYIGRIIRFQNEWRPFTIESDIYKTKDEAIVKFAEMKVNQIIIRLNIKELMSEPWCDRVLDWECTKSNFDVFLDEELGWIIQTSFCQIGGCVADYLLVENEETGHKLAMEMTIFGFKPDLKGLCSSCRQEWYESQI
jgi:hypothetical protein